jgi:hypothetical protein
MEYRPVLFPDDMVMTTGLVGGFLVTLERPIRNAPPQNNSKDLNSCNRLTGIDHVVNLFTLASAAVGHLHAMG